MDNYYRNINYIIICFMLKGHISLNWKKFLGHITHTHFIHKNSTMTVLHIIPSTHIKKIHTYNSTHCSKAPYIKKPLSTFLGLPFHSFPSPSVSDSPLFTLISSFYVRVFLPLPCPLPCLFFTKPFSFLFQCMIVHSKYL